MELIFAEFGPFRVAERPEIQQQFHMVAPPAVSSDAFLVVNVITDPAAD